MDPQPDSPRAPFDDADATVIFRSSDGVTFHLYKDVMAKASPIMRDMFMLPDNPHSRLQVVDLTENARTLESVFRLCYPVQFPTIATVEHLLAVIEATEKYEMAGVLDNVRHLMQPILDKEPLRVFAIAYMYQMEDITRLTARQLLGEDGQSFMPPSSPPKEFTTLSAIALYNLHTYRVRCVTAAKVAVKDLKLIVAGNHSRRITVTSYPNRTPEEENLSWSWALDRNLCTCPKIFITIDGRSYRVPGWLTPYLDALSDAVSKAPYGRIVRSFLTTDEATAVLAAGKFCGGTNCFPKVLMDIIFMNDLLADNVDSAVDKVSQ